MYFFFFSSLSFFFLPFALTLSSPPCSFSSAGAYVSYLEGCTAPARSEHQLHAAVVELVALEDAYIKYSTVQNWCVSGIYVFVCVYVNSSGVGGLGNVCIKYSAIQNWYVVYGCM
jgi:hypothetical protein